MYQYLLGRVDNMIHLQENNMSLISRVIHLKDSHGNKTHMSICRLEYWV